MKNDLNKKQAKLPLTNSPFVCFFATLILLFLLMALKAPSYPHRSPVYYYYTLDYSLGFSARMLIGSLLKLLFSDKLTDGNIYCLSVVLFVGICILYSVLLGRFLSSQPKELRLPVSLIAVTAVFNPYSLTFFFSRNNFIRLESHCLFLSMLCVVLLKNRYLRWFIPVLCFAATAIYEAYMFTFMPLIGLMLLFYVLKNNFKPSDVALCALSYAVIIGSFIYFQFFTKTGSLIYDDVFSLMDALSQRYTGEFEESGRNALYIQFFAGSAADYTKEALLPMLRDMVKNYLPQILLMLSPVFAVIVPFYLSCMKKAEKPTMKFFFFVCLILPVASLPLFVLAVDYSRWAACAVTTWILSLLCISFCGREYITGSLYELKEKILKNPAFYLTCVILSTALCFSGSADRIIPSIGKPAYDHWLAWLENRVMNS